MGKNTIEIVVRNGEEEKKKKGESPEGPASREERSEPAPAKPQEPTASPDPLGYVDQTRAAGTYPGWKDVESLRTEGHMHHDEEYTFSPTHVADAQREADRATRRGYREARRMKIADEPMPGAEDVEMDLGQEVSPVDIGSVASAAADEAQAEAETNDAGSLRGFVSPRPTYGIGREIDPLNPKTSEQIMRERVMSAAGKSLGVKPGSPSTGDPDYDKGYEDYSMTALLEDLVRQQQEKADRASDNYDDAMALAEDAARRGRSNKIVAAFGDAISAIVNLAGVSRGAYNQRQGVYDAVADVVDKGRARRYESLEAIRKNVDAQLDKLNSYKLSLAQAVTSDRQQAAANALKAQEAALARDKFEWEKEKFDIEQRYKTDKDAGELALKGRAQDTKDWQARQTVGQKWRQLRQKDSELKIKEITAKAKADKEYTRHYGEFLDYMMDYIPDCPFKTWQEAVDARENGSWRSLPDNVRTMLAELYAGVDNSAKAKAIMDTYWYNLKDDDDVDIDEEFAGSGAPSGNGDIDAWLDGDDEPEPEPEPAKGRRRNNK